MTLAEEATFEPGSLAKNRMSGPNAAITPNSSSPVIPGALDPLARSYQVVDLTGSNDGRPATSTSAKDAYEPFISAVVSALVSTLCSTTGAIPLNARTLLLPRHMHGESNADTPHLASLRAYLTTTGVLVAMVNLSLAEGLSLFSDTPFLPPLGVTVLAAPLGVFATCHAVANNEHPSAESMMGQSPDLQVLRLRPDRDERLNPWRRFYSKLLEARNLPSPISGTQKWLSLQRVRRKPVEPRFDGKRTPLLNTCTSMSWPSNLCFCKAFSKLAVSGVPEEAPDALAEQSYDPLALAKSWFLGAAERDELLAKRAKERETVAAPEVPHPEGQAQQSNGLSPLALHRPANAGAPPGAMYPTPPDGVQMPVGITPSVDGLVSSPVNNPATAAAVVDVEMTKNAPPADPFPEAWEAPVVKRERGNGSFDSENLFGDLGPDMFGGENDITDADFNFFDEQPGAMDISLEMSDMPTGMPQLDAAPDFSHPTFAAAPAMKPDPVAMPTPSAAPEIVFAKPELKHARSSLAQESKKPTETGSSRQEPPTLKRQASPFNPDTVFKRIKASIDNYTTVKHGSQQCRPRSDSIFEKVDFGPDLSTVNSKYQGNGRFDFTPSRSEDSQLPISNAPPTTNYLKRHGKGRRNTKPAPPKLGELLARFANGNATSQPTSPARVDDPLSDADDVSLISDQDDSSYESDEPASPVKSVSIRRKRPDDDGESLATSFKELESMDAASPRLSFDMPVSSKSDPDLPLLKYFADPEPSIFQPALSDQDLVIAAQILTEQVSTSTLCLASTSQCSAYSSLDRRRDLLAATHKLVNGLQATFPACFGGDAAGYQFRPFVEVQDVPLMGQASRMQPRAPGTEQLKPSNPYQIPSPHFEVRRYESRLSVLPTAISFWESLGLGPSLGGKDVNAICIYPEVPGLADSADVFLDRMQSVYESLKLGSFNRMDASAGLPGGLLSYQIGSRNETFQGPATILGSAGAKLCDTLLNLGLKETNVAVFIVYCQDVHGAAIESCYAFHQLSEMYKKAQAHGGRPENDMALQLIPMDFLASPASLPMPLPADFTRLAIETYDRCTLFRGASPSPAIVLEQTFPRMPEFKLTTTPSSSPMHENSCLHIAYSQSIDERWITAAWTDNRGSQYMTASYCLGRKGKPIATPFADVAREMWETTRGIISTRKVHWRIMIAKCGVLEQNEMDMWASLVQDETRHSTSLTLVAVDTDPSLQLLPPSVRIPSTASAVFYTTPVSTPQPSVVSPEQSGNPPTPSLRFATTSAPSPGGGGANDNGESDADATLVDVTDHTWGAMLAHRLSNSAVLTDFNPAIASGYLVKRSGPRPEDPLSVLEVNIVQSDGNPRAYEGMMRELLTHYRGLGTLARARGIVDKDVDIRPWHIAAAEKGCRAMYLLA